MKFNLNPKIRFALYVITGVASIYLTYLSGAQSFSEPAIQAFGTLVTFISGLAAINVSE